MENLAKEPACLFQMLLILFTFYYLTVPLSQAADPNSFSQCLTLQKVTNFSLHTISQHNSSAGYEHFLKFSLQNLRFYRDSVPKPAAIVFPNNKEQLIDSIGCSKRTSINIRIRCGGHSDEALSSTSHNDHPFVIIDMMNLNRVTVDIESETAWVEGGATLGELYYAIAQHSNELGFSAGLCSSVGVGGHFSGGGFGLLSRKYGLAADNVVDAVLIDAAGHALDRAAMGEDIFWALRGGGGGNFGVVYKWKVQLVKVPPMVTSVRIWRYGSNHQLAKLLHKWQFVAPSLDDGYYFSVILYSTSNNEVELMFEVFYLGLKTEVMSTMNKQFPELDIKKEDYKEMSWIDSVLYFAHLKEGSTVHDLKSRVWDERSSYKRKSDFVKKPISVEGLEGALDLLAMQPKGSHLILEAIRGIMDRISSDSIAYPHRKSNLYHILYAATWEEEEEEEQDRCLKWVQKIYNYMTPFVSSNPRANSVNYVDLDLGTSDNKDDDRDDDAVGIARAWGERYFLSNYDRLVRVKTMIDPDNIFKHEQSIPPFDVSIRDDM